MLIKLFVVVACVPLAFIDAAIALVGKQCGSKICNIMEFCSSFHNQCENCESICTATAHNYDQGICTSQCQDYLHEIRYAKPGDYSAEIQRLQRQQTVLLILLVILLLLFISVHGIQAVRWLYKKEYLGCGKSLQKKKMVHNSETITVANPHTRSPKLNIRKANHISGNASVFSVSGIEGSTMHTVSTPISTRYPAEDNTLDYSYDNAALQITPNSDKPRTETVF